MQIVFWVVFFILFYTYFGYGLLLFFFNTIFKKRKIEAGHFFPSVTFIVPAYNEEAVIKKKIENTLALAYPPGKISFLFVTDGSDDNTVTILDNYHQIKVMHQPLRKGKSAAIDRAMHHVSTPVVVFSDANTMLNPQSIQKLVRHYADQEVGGVSGEKRIRQINNTTVGLGERLYWQYESLLKKTTSDFYTIIGAAGELFSIRTNLYRRVGENIILDDFFISASVCDQGYRFLYDSEAFGIEASSATIVEERKRKVRISEGCFQALFRLKSLLNPFKNFRVTFQYVSHRVLRWTLCPLLLPLFFIVNFILCTGTTGWLYETFFALQCTFYFLAFLGWLLAEKNRVVRSMLIPYYFVFMILSQYGGFYRFITKKQSGIWQKSARVAEERQLL